VGPLPKFNKERDILECAGITLGDLDLGAATLKVAFQLDRDQELSPRNKTSGAIDLRDAMVNELSEHLERNGLVGAGPRTLVFCTENCTARSITRTGGPGSGCRRAKRRAWPGWGSTSNQASPSTPTPDHPHDSAEWERETVANMQRWGEAPPGLAPKSHYTLADVSHMEELLKTRATENKDNAAEFLGDYGQATIEMWTAHVTEVMITQAEKSEFFVLGEICKFFIIKTVETIAGAYGGPFAVWVAEAFEKELSHALAEKATEWTTAAGAELLSSSLKEGDIEGKKKEIEKVAGGLGDHLKEMSKQTIAGLPETEPAAEWLGFVRGSPDPSYRRWAAFRLPPLFPKVNEQLIRTTVAANIVTDLGAQGVVPVPDKSPEYDIWNHRKASSIEEGVIGAHVFADGFGPLRVFSAFEAPEDLRKELVGHPISEMPTVPLRVHIHGNTMPGGGAAGLYKWPFLEDSFAKVFPDPGAAAITRDQAGLVRVTDFGLPELIVLYGQLHSGDGHGPGPFGSPEGRLKGPFDSPEGRGQGFEPASEISDDPLDVLIQDAMKRALGPGPVSPDDIPLYVRARLLSQREAGAQALMEIVAQSSLGDTPADKWERITVR
jgi:hypothetical protein